MARKLKEELKQLRPWTSVHEEAVLNVARTAAMFDHAAAQLLKPFGITPTQYNVLRILRGAGDAGLCRNEVGERLIRPVPDVTRLLDRLEEMKLIERRRSGSDRRFVGTFITDQGLRMLEELDEPVRAFHRLAVGHLDPHQLASLIDLLETARDGG